MKYVVWSLGAIVVFIAVILAIGSFLPVSHVAARSATFNKPADVVFAAISDPANYATWRSDVSRIEMLEPTDGKVRFREHSSNGPIVMEIVESTAPTRMVTRIADPDQPFGGTWTFEIGPAENGSTLTITERGEVYNPIFRFMSRFIFGHTAGLEGYLQALQRKLG